jgi:hypothetical protein
MDQFQCMLSPLVSLAREQAPLLLAGEAHIEELVHLLDGGEASDQLITQRRHVDVAQPGVLASGTLLPRATRHTGYATLIVSRYNRFFTCSTLASNRPLGSRMSISHSLMRMP